MNCYSIWLIAPMGIIVTLALVLLPSTVLVLLDLAFGDGFLWRYITTSRHKR